MNLPNKDKRYNDVRLIFHEADHKYNDSLGNDYISTTTILHQYAPAFDKEYWLNKKARELKISRKELEKQWDKIKNEACERGSDTHNGLENGVKENSQFINAIRYLNELEDGEMVTVADLDNISANYKLLDVEKFREATDNRYSSLYDAYQRYVDKGYFIYAEIGMFLLDYLISGTIDVLIVAPDYKSFVIGDYKTNRGGLKFTSGYYKKDKTQRPAQQTDIWVEKKETLLPPVDNLPNCNGSTYNLQLSMYAKAVELITGMTCKGLWLAHIDSDFELNEYGMPKRFPDGLYHIKKNPKEKVTFYNMPYRKDEIERILEDRRKNLIAANVKRSFDLFS